VWFAENVTFEQGNLIRANDTVVRETLGHRVGFAKRKAVNECLRGFVIEGCLVDVRGVALVR
tara:strand:+ start:207 stop:392 length:186 start_codon:yes stop_codon:yes gene_type:complete